MNLKVLQKQTRLYSFAEPSSSASSTPLSSQQLLFSSNVVYIL